MPRDRVIIFGDLIGKLDMLRVSCDKCGRDGCYGLAKLIDSVAAMASSSIGWRNSPPIARRKSHYFMAQQERLTVNRPLKP
jgi:hypothetical protein